MAPAYRADEILAVAGVRGQIVRPAACAAWAGSLPAPDLDDPQLVASTSLVPLIWTAEGVLAGERITGRRRLIVVSDPDLLATHGLGRGRNADLALALLERLDPAGGRAVVVDETLHGHELQPSLARELLRWPLALATLQGALALGLLAWAALVRFGRPRQAATGLAPGKAFLVENTAELLQQGGHVARAVASYWRAAKEQIARTLHPPGEVGGDPDAVVARGAAARGRGEELAVLERRVAELSHQRSGEHDALRVARDVHAFREVMTHAARSDS
jgi:hypothetical protein